MTYSHLRGKRCITIMAPRIANDSFPDEFLMVDYDNMGVPAPMGAGGRGIGGMGGGGGMGMRPTVNDINGGGGDGIAAAAGTAAGGQQNVAVMTMAGMQEEFNAGGTNTTTATAGGGGTFLPTGNNNNDDVAAAGTTGGIGDHNYTMTSSSIENDPLSVQPSLQTNGRSHSSEFGMTSDNLMMDRYAVPHHHQQQYMHDHHSTGGGSGSTTLDTTVTVTMAAAAQHAWDQFVAGQGVVVGGGGGGGGYSPSSMPAHPFGDTPVLQYHHHRIQHQHQHHHQQQQQQSTSIAALSHIPLAPTTVSRSNSVASSLTSPNSAPPSRTNSLPPPSSTNSVTHLSTAAGSATASGIATTTYQRFLSSLPHPSPRSPLEPISPSTEPSSTPLENSPQETYASIHETSEHDGSLFGSPNDTHSASGRPVSTVSLSGGGGGVSIRGDATSSPKISYSPSLLDQTSFPEEEDLSVGDDYDDDQNMGGGGEVDGKYSPISKLDWGDDVEGGVKNRSRNTSDITADTTAITMDDSQVANLSSSAILGGLSRGLTSQVIHENSTFTTPPLLQPRPVPTSVGPQPQYLYQVADVSVASNDGSVQLDITPPPLSFGNDTTISDLMYYAEKGCIVDVLAALTNPHLKTLGSRMLADYAKLPHRRVAVASNSRILDFVVHTALEIGSHSPYDQAAQYTSLTWLGREYSVETVRSLTAAEENDQYLMNSPGLLKMLALVARGGPFVQLHSTPLLGQQVYMSPPVIMSVPPPTSIDNGTPGPRLMMVNTMGIASDKARLHACIAIMNLSCGKSNKIEITSVSEILEAMRDVMLGRHFAAQPRSSLSSTRAVNTLSDEARLKATTCIKNLSNADANDAALLGTPGLVETLGYVAEATCHPRTGATTCTTHACLALMNLSISKANKNRVFRTSGVMDALMAVITRTALRTSPSPDGSGSEMVNPKDPNFEARVKACSALSNLAIGYDNKVSMFNYPGFVESILTVILTDKAEARTKACSILWSFAAEMKNQVPVVQRGDIVPVLVSVAKEDTKTEARFKCVAALTLLAESPENAVPLLCAGSLEPLMTILHEAGPDPTQWRGQTASWCVGFLMNMAQCDEVVPALLQEGIVDLLAPLLALDHYQSLKAAMAVTFVCQYDTGDRTYNLLRQTENVIPKIVGLLHNTLSGRGGSGYKYGVFTLRSSVGCIASLAAGPDFIKERIATNPVIESLLKVVEDFCVDGGTPGAIVGGGKDDTCSVTLAVRALSSLIGHLIPEPGCAAMPFGPAMDDKLITALGSFEKITDIDELTLSLAHAARIRVEGGKNLHGRQNGSVTSDSSPDDMSDDGVGLGLSLARKFFPFPCGMNLHVPSNQSLTEAPVAKEETMDVTDDAVSATTSGDLSVVRTFLLTDGRTGRRFAVPCDPTGGRQFNDNRVWCYRRGRFCNEGESPDVNFAWSDELQDAYMVALKSIINESLSRSSRH